ncbi:stage II sporulation protein B [Evansella vedderi]|uniref:Stage II sporulation protein B n=1 Tax=Evansella vedderi TaxID=38282 RepID=A0ABU0A064_9BACI|nr:hypothetical protein [Evansella vedderi]MDQ0256509.1 stage II sporulation protein B [Evansella vedderi]
MEKKNNISIRLNGKEKPYYERKQDVKSNKPYTNHEEVAAAKEETQTGWMSFDKEEKDKEKDKSTNVVDLGKIREEKTDRSMPFWDDGKRDYGPRLPPFGRKKRRPIKFNLEFLFNSLFLSIVAAIVVGSAFGLMLLNIFTDNETPALVNGSENGGVTTEQESPVVGDNEALGHPIPIAEFFVVQGGAFSTTEKGTETVNNFHSKGLPGVLTENTDPYFLFVGVGYTREDADKIASVYEELQQETYIKGFGVAPEAGEVSEEWAHFMERGIIWMEQAASVSAKELAGDSLSESEIEGMLEAGQQWKNAFRDVEPRGEGDPVYELGKQWVQTAEPAFQVFTSGAISSEIAWDAQSKVLESILIYENLVETIVHSQQ